MMARDQVSLIVRQQPTRAQVVQENNPKNRKPIDPPPIIELKYDDRNDPSNSQWLVSPRTFMMVTLVDEKDSKQEARGESPGKLLIGQTVSSLHRLKDVTNKDGGFFVFGDISARRLGNFRLRFSLFDTIKESDEVLFMGSIESDPFPVLAQRDFGSMSESTHLTRTFSDQGVKLRVRKDTRAISSIAGTKRSFNASPPGTSSPGLHSAMYGGAVQDHYSTSSPAVKRQRAGSEYDTSHLYSIPGSDSHLSHYSSSIPSGTRAWAGSDSQRVPAAYGQQQSPMNMSMSGRMQHPMGVQAHTPPSWSNINSQSALPSPTPSVSNQQPPTYPTTTSQQQSSSIFGDPGSASSVPRNPYYNTYPTYSTHSQYPGQSSGDIQSAYDLQMPGSSIADTSSLAAAHTPGYGHGYLQSSSLYSSEPHEVSGPYPYSLDEKYQHP